MTIKSLRGNRRLSLIGFSIASAIALTAISVPLSSASAQGFVGLQLGPFAVGVGNPYYPYYHPYYYPYYNYPPPVYYYPY